MPKPLSPDLRRRVLEASRSATAEATALRFNVSVTTVHRLRALERETGSVSPRAHGGGRKRSLSDEDRACFEAFLKENVSMTHTEMAARFSAEQGKPTSRASVQRYMEKWALTRKKR